MHNIITGINADVVNVHEVFTIVVKMEGQVIFSYSHKCNSKAKTLAKLKAIKEAEDRTIDSALLFQRLLVVSQIVELDLDEMMKYELSLQPPSLFKDMHRQRKPNKSSLLEAEETSPRLFPRLSTMFDLGSPFKD